jgi:hypothetical protein
VRPIYSYGRLASAMSLLISLASVLLLLVWAAEAQTSIDVPITVTHSGGGGGCTPSGSPCPVGATPPAGYHFNLTIDDEFPQDGGVLNTSLWGCAGGCSTYPGQVYLNSEGLNLQPTAAVSGCATQQGDRACDAGIGSLFSPRFGFWEWSARYPRGFDGSGDGYHVDIYVNNNISTDRTSYDEESLGESGLGTSSANYANMYYAQGGTNAPFNLNSPVPMSDAFHTFGFLWVNDGSQNGAASNYLDGNALISGYHIDPAWGSGGAAIIMESVSCFTPAQHGWNGNPCSASTATSGNPFVFKYFRYWQLVPN